MRKTVLTFGIITIFIAVLIMIGKETYHWLDSGSGSQEIESTENNDGQSEQIVDVLPDNDQESDHEEANSEEQIYFITEDDFAAFEEKGLNPFGRDITQENLTDQSFQDYIHGMSHQKVRAEKKWGFYEIHPIRIKWLLEGLDQVDVKYASVYREILEKWEKGNFQEVDEDHNKIWNLQGGTVGKATGILSAEEEQQFLKEKYNQ